MSASSTLTLWLAVSLLATVAQGREPTAEAKSGPVGIAMQSDSIALVASANVIHRIDSRLAPLSGRRIVGKMPARWKIKSPATCPSCDFVLFIGWLKGRTSIHAAPLDGSHPPVEVRAAIAGTRWKHLVLDRSGRRAYATDNKSNRIWEFSVDPEGPAFTSERTLLEVKEPYNLALLPDDAGLLVTNREDHLRLVGWDGRVMADWDVGGVCGLSMLRAAALDPTTNAVYVLDHSTIWKLETNPDRSAVESCTFVAGHPKRKGFVDACGRPAEFASPHDIEFLVGPPALLLSDTQNRALRRVSLAPGADYGCTSTVPMLASIPPRSERSCDELDWPSGAGSSMPHICSGPPVPADHCGGRVHYATAAATCHWLGARLCTSAELAADAARDHACFAKDRRTWSATPCAGSDGKSSWDNGHISQAAALSGLAESPPTCMEDEPAATRCCADAR